MTSDAARNASSAVPGVGGRIVCVTGPDGAGKTTQIQRIAERLERREKKKVAPVTIWDLLLEPAAQGAVPFKSPGEVDRYLAILSPLARTLFLYHCLAEALAAARKKEPDVLLVNAYWYKYYATEVAHGADPATTLALAERCFPEPDLTFYLSIDPDRSSGRKAGYSGYETGYATPRSREAFVAFQQKAGPHLADLARTRNWIALDGQATPDGITDLIMTRIRETK